MEPPQELLKGSNTADNRSGRVRSLYTAPILQRSPHATLEIMPSRAPEFSSARNFQEHNKTVYLPKDENKEGTGYRLLNVSGGPAGRVCPLPDHLEGWGRT